MFTLNIYSNAIPGCLLGRNIWHLFPFQALLELV